MGRILTPPPRDERKQADVYGSRRVASHLASHLKWTPRAMVCAMVLPRTSRDQAAPATKAGDPAGLPFLPLSMRFAALS